MSLFGIYLIIIANIKINTKHLDILNRCFYNYTNHSSNHSITLWEFCRSCPGGTHLMLYYVILRKGIQRQFRTFKNQAKYTDGHQHHQVDLSVKTKLSECCISRYLCPICVCCLLLSLSLFLQQSSPNMCSTTYHSWILRL